MFNRSNGKAHRKQQVLRLRQNPTFETQGTLKYQYTVDNTFLSKEQRDFYEDNGFLVIRKLVEPSHIETYKER